MLNPPLWGSPWVFRHTFASLLIAAGVNAKAIAAYLGHASIQTTFDLYGRRSSAGVRSVMAPGAE